MWSARRSYKYIVCGRLAPGVCDRNSGRKNVLKIEQKKKAMQEGL